ncbi:MAG: hypothetical protein FWC50_14915 [Planctomycetaceae bacterium]|nr:hypothetical protein [Planctomycetaceae bacterium]
MLLRSSRPTMSMQRAESQRGERHPHPDPPKLATLKEWVTQNIPNDGKKDTKYLADCFDNAASGMERGTIRTVDAGYASVRTCSQTKVSNKIWGGFFDSLEKEVTVKLGDGNVKDLATLYRQIAQGLRGDAVSNAPNAKTFAVPTSTGDNCPTGNCPAR